MLNSRPRNRLAMAALLVLLAVAAAPMTGCGSGGGGGGDPFGDLEVCAEDFFFGDFIYRVDVSDNFSAFNSSQFTFDDLFHGDCEVINTYLEGNYTVDVFWSDGITFPTAVDTDFSVDIFGGFVTTHTSVR